jgi:hypothetical protein
MKCCDTRRATQDLSDLLFANGQLRVHQRSAQRYILAPAWEYHPQANDFLRQKLKAIKKPSQFGEAFFN